MSRDYTIITNYYISSLVKLLFPPESIITSSFVFLAFYVSVTTSAWNMEPVVWIVECIWAYLQTVNSSRVMETSVLELKAPAPASTTWSLLTSLLSSWHLSLAPYWTLLCLGTGFSLPPLFSYWLASISFETYFKMLLKPLMSVNVFICPNNGLLFWVDIKFCAEKPCFLEFWKFIPWYWPPVLLWRSTILFFWSVFFM